MTDIGTLGIKGNFKDENIKAGIDQVVDKLDKVDGKIKNSGKIAQESAIHQRKWNLAIGQSLIGIEDFFTVVGTSGIGGGLRASANNIAQSFRIMMGPGIAAGFAAIGVSLSSLIIPSVIRWASGQEEVDETIKNIIEGYKKVHKTAVDIRGIEKDRAKLLADMKNIPDGISSTSSSMKDFSFELESAIKNTRTLQAQINFKQDPSIGFRGFVSFITSGSVELDASVKKISDRTDALNMALHALNKESEKVAVSGHIDRVKNSLKELEQGPITTEKLDNVTKAIKDFDKHLELKLTKRGAEGRSRESISLLGQARYELDTYLDVINEIKDGEHFDTIIEEGQRLADVMEENKMKLQEYEKTLRALIEKRMSGIAGLKEDAGFEQGSPLVSAQELNKIISDRLHIEEQIIDLRKKGDDEQANRLTEQADKFVNSVIETNKEAKERLNIEEQIRATLISGTEDHVQAAFKVTEQYRKTLSVAEDITKEARAAASDAERNIKLDQANALRGAAKGQLNKDIADLENRLKESLKGSIPEFSSSLVESRTLEAVLSARASAQEQLASATVTSKDDEAQKKRDEIAKTLEAIEDILNNKPLIARRI